MYLFGDQDLGKLGLSFNGKVWKEACLALGLQDTPVPKFSLPTVLILKCSQNHTKKFFFSGGHFVM